MLLWIVGFAIIAITLIVIFISRDRGGAKGLYLKRFNFDQAKSKERLDLQDRY
ncbi:MAG: hypothetical protein KKB20_14490 [Proteobacteria bacterium]|nr:hypothetical protein [Pseudomonadota bacterium]